MISFITLLIGITVGTRPIEVRAGPSVATVEFRLDGRLLALLTAPPWKTTVDFGVPMPHELVAVARDDRGAEIGRIVQRINFPRSLAEATLTLLPGKGGRGRAASLAWATAVGEKPRAVELTMDGRPLTADNLERIALPDFRPADVHILRAVLDFGEGARATAELLFGGLRGRVSQPGPDAVRDATEAELTAVPAVFKGTPPKETGMDGWFLADGEPVRVEAVEESPGQIVAVKDESVGPWLAGLHASAFFSAAVYRCPLGKGQSVRFCWPGTSDRSAPGYDVFLRSAEYAGPLDLRRVLIGVEPPACSDLPRLADAVSVAGLLAVAGNRPRAVLLLVAGPGDSSSMPVDWVRGYLRALRVPLYVWAKDKKTASAWDKVEVLTSVSDLKAAASRITAAVEHQRIVWIEGRHLPQSISLSPKARSVTLVE